MATLYVRDVPDDLYDRLRKRAGEHGSSISAEAVRLLERSLGGDPRGDPQVLGPGRGTTLEGPAGHPVAGRPDPPGP